MHSILCTHSSSCSSCAPVGAVLLLLLCLTGAEVLAGGIYRWQDADGRWHFGDRPPAGARTEAVHPRVNAVAPSRAVRTRARQLASGEGQGAGDHRPSVVMYSASWCGVCKRARRYFRQEGIPFREYDVERTQKGRRDYQRLGGRGVPLILVGGQRMDGFSPGRFQRLWQAAAR